MIRILRPDMKYAETIDELFVNKSDDLFTSIANSNDSLKLILNKVFGNNLSIVTTNYVQISRRRRLLATFWGFYDRYFDGTYDDNGNIKGEIFEMGAAMIYNEFYQKWNNSVTIFQNTERDALAPYSMNINENNTDDLDSTNEFSSDDTQTLKGSTTGNESNQNTQNVYGFNSDTAVPSDTGNSTTNQSTNVDNTNTGKHTSTTKISRSNPTTRDITRIGSIGNIPNQDLVIRELDLQRRRLQEMIYNDMDTLFVRSMYKDCE